MASHPVHQEILIHNKQDSCEPDSIDEIYENQDLQTKVEKLQDRM
jgi:hypothetical protein